MSHKYIIRFSGEKRVDDWDPEQGAAGKDRIVDNWEASIESNTKPTLAQFNDFTYDRYGIGAREFRYWPNEPPWSGRFSANRVEDADGNSDNNGKYLADYDVYVTCVPTQNPVPVGHLGLKPIS
jgi:hypothetical protein